MTGTRRRNRPIYLDHQATTPVDRRVLDAMIPYFTEMFGGAGSDGHWYGREADAAVERARAQVAAGIGADPREISFTAGATEADNLAILGAARFRRANRDRRDGVVTVATEHPSVLESCAALAREGFKVEIVPVGSDGRVDMDRVRSAVTDRTALVSAMAANNEIGVLHPLAEIGAVCRRWGAWFHSNAAQAVTKIPIDVEAMQIDLLSLSAHKLYGPKGIGALYIRRRPRVRLEPLLYGGREEGGIRPGTVAVPLCVGLGEAVAIGVADLVDDGVHDGVLRDRLLEKLRSIAPDLRINGSLEHRLPGNLNVAFPGVAADALLAEIDGQVAISASGISTYERGEPSHVLKALGIDDLLATASVRIGVGRGTEAEEVDEAADAIGEAVRAIRGPARGGSDRSTGEINWRSRRQPV